MYHPKEIENLLALEGDKKYRTVLSRIAEGEEIYFLSMEESLLSYQDDEGNALLPLWSDKPLAELNVPAEDKDVEVLTISLEDFLYDYLVDFHENNLQLLISPRADENPVISQSPADFAKDLLLMMAEYFGDDEIEPYLAHLDFIQFD